MEGDTALELNDVTRDIIGAAMRVHSALGPGLFESVYERCLTHELKELGRHVQNQLTYPVIYDGIRIGRAFRIDLLVECRVIVEVKAVTAILPVHEGQLTSYLRLADCRVGLLINFHARHLRDGIKRIVNKL
jgi:GxxExxY protein